MAGPLILALVTILSNPAVPSAAGAGSEARFEPFSDYRVVLWIGESAYKDKARVGLFFQRLREMGANAGMVYGAGDPGPLVENHIPYYVENVVNKGLCLKWNSKVQDWESFVTAWHKARDQASLVREYCLDDTAWRAWAAEQMTAAALRNRDHHPIAYDIRDELSVTISANPFDYDFSPASLAAFRQWLMTVYPDLDALNREWQTRFSAWGEVRPFTTDAIKARMASAEAMPQGSPDWQRLQALRFDPITVRQSATSWNLAPWCDFRSYMDLALARTLDDLRKAAHAVDPATPVGIEGTQMPHAFGGYDLVRLSKVLDWVEPYDIGCSREIFGSFMEGKPLLTTVFETQTQPALRRLWHLLLLGDRGCLVWWSEDCMDWASANYGLTAKAKALRPALQEMTGPLARLFLRAERVTDPVAIHYSQPSIQVDWLIESCVDGPTWLRRFSSYEADHNRMAKARKALLKATQDIGYSPRFISCEQIEKGGLSAYKALVLPGSVALSDQEVSQIQAFLKAGQGEKVVLSDGTPGLFDEHGRLRPASPLEDRFPVAAPGARCFAAKSGLSTLSAASREGDIAAYVGARLGEPPDLAWLDWIRGAMAGLAPEVALAPADARVTIHRFTLAKARLLAFERNIDYQMSEDLKQAGGNQALERPVDLTARLIAACHVYDLREAKYLGLTDRIPFRLDPWRPSLFALLDEEVPASQVIERLLRADRVASGEALSHPAGLQPAG